MLTRRDSALHAQQLDVRSVHLYRTLSFVFYPLPWRIILLYSVDYVHYILLGQSSRGRLLRKPGIYKQWVSNEIE
jgi:hypothetical protein